MAGVQNICELCGRSVSRRTKHHLIPRSRHKNKKNKRTFDREEVRTRLAWLCRPCHSQVHALLTEKELEYDYNSLDSLRTHPELNTFLKWIGTKPDGTTVPVRKKRGNNTSR